MHPRAGSGARAPAVSRRGLAVLLCSLVPMLATAEQLAVTTASGALPEGREPLGQVEMEGVGPVRVDARRDGVRLRLWALDRQGRVLGRTDTFAGVSESALHISTTGGIRRIDVLWGAGTDAAPGGQ
jgi:hypothetical protein